MIIAAIVTAAMIISAVLSVSVCVCCVGVGVTAVVAVGVAVGWFVPLGVGVAPEDGVPDVLVPSGISLCISIAQLLMLLDGQQSTGCAVKLTWLFGCKSVESTSVKFMLTTFPSLLQNVVITLTSPIVCDPVFVTFPVTVYVPLLVEVLLVACRSWYWFASEL